MFKLRPIVWIVIAVGFALLGLWFWWYAPVALCRSDGARACEVSSDCTLEPGTCCNVQDAYNSSYYERCNQARSFHCQMECIDVYRPVCDHGRCAYELDAEQTAERRRHAMAPPGVRAE